MTAYAAFALVWGMMWGSFLNVVIARMPFGISIVRPGSRCPKCSAGIRWWDNIPVLSFILLRGRCRDCRQKISWRYPFVEVVAGLATLGIFLHYGLSIRGVETWTLIMALIALTVIDLDHRILPDAITLPGIAVGLAFSFSGQGLASAVQAVAGAAVGFGFFWVISWAYYKWKKVEGLGGGDVKLLAMLGAFVGIAQIPVVVIVSSLAGTAVGIAAMLVRKEGLQMAIPFGPFLALGGLVSAFWGNAVLTWYLGTS